ncbi:MAG: hypothetical protein WD648_12370 [Planctomycetaceae bacterium]
MLIDIGFSCYPAGCAITMIDVCAAPDELVAAARFEKPGFLKKPGFFEAAVFQKPSAARGV